MMIRSRIALPNVSPRLASHIAKRTVVSSSISPLASNSVDDSRNYSPDHVYPTKGKYVQSSTEPNEATGRPMPLNVLLTKYAPMKHPITHGDNVCDLQIRSFHTGDLEFFCNFALRVAFYLKIPVKGVTPLPRRRERWTVIKSPFIHAKSKENFERRTHKRLIQLYDANPETVQMFLATVRKYCMPGVGMKASIYQQEDLDVLGRLDTAVESEASLLGDNFEGVDAELAQAVKAILESPEFKPIMEEHEAKTNAATAEAASKKSKSSSKNKSKATDA